MSSLVRCLSPSLVQAVARAAFALALPKLPAAGPLLQHSTALPGDAPLQAFSMLERRAAADRSSRLSWTCAAHMFRAAVGPSLVAICLPTGLESQPKASQKHHCQKDPFTFPRHLPMLKGLQSAILEAPAQLPPLVELGPASKKIGITTKQFVCFRTAQSVPACSDQLWNSWVC